MCESETTFFNFVNLPKREKIPEKFNQSDRPFYIDRFITVSTPYTTRCSGSSAGLSTIPVSYRFPVRALPEPLPCKSWIPDLIPYLSNRQVSD
ncbi:hypothetical protein DPMN_001866 [Dreissena polymorpha]|uniref:Uncharacterized protein n=1 Tax=Dreissena polymorpha TaxID=45954 RepID=A0A9D4MI23_DREPO|nr:hypothetical protein DPMN_001866 [Dreissena polymorpha]